jgi:two-component system, NtrC family, response regulator HydG
VRPLLTVRPEHPRRILLVDDDEDIARFHALVLRGGGYDVTVLHDPVQALQRIGAEPYDLLVSDIQMPAMTGLELTDRLRVRAPRLPAILVTAHATVEAAIGAVRTGAVDFVTKPVAPADLLAAAKTAMTRADAGCERVLAVGAHPDDVEIGVGATLLAHRARGDQVCVLTMSRGGTGGAEELRVGEAQLAASLLGATLLLADLEDTHIPEGNPTISLIERAVTEHRPDIVYVHSRHDNHQDHRSVHAATMVAARRVDRIYGFRSPSATVDYRPTRFVSADQMLDRKLEVIRAYASQAAREYMDEELVRAQARSWGASAGSRYAEPLEVIRERAAAGAGPQPYLTATTGAPDVLA